MPSTDCAHCWHMYGGTMDHDAVGEFTGSDHLRCCHCGREARRHWEWSRRPHGVHESGYPKPAERFELLSLYSSPVPNE